MAITCAARDAVDMRIGTITRPGEMTRDRYDQLLAERLHQELAELTMIRRPELSIRVRDVAQQGEEPADNPVLIGALEDMALLDRRIMLLHVAWSHQRTARG
jgi:hypothetical protein